MLSKRLKLLGIIFSRLRGLAYIFKKKGLKAAYNYLWVHIFTRDSGLALFDPVLRKFPSLAPYPQTIEIEITTRCHLRCIICEHTYWSEAPRNMSLDEFKKIVDQFPKLKWLGITGIGSNFLNKDFISMLRYVKSKSVYVEFFDTFDLIDEENAEKLISVGVNKIWMSIDAATAETYNKIRVGTDFNKVMNNLCKFIELKIKHKTPFPEIWFHYIINKYNYQELPEFVKLVSSVIKKNANLATMIYFTNILHFKDVEHLRVSLPPEIKKVTELTAKKYGIYLGWNENINPTRPVCQCTRWTEPFILATGHVQPCCAINEANTRRYQKEKSLGNLLEIDFHEIWKKNYRELIKKIHSNEFPEICKHCRNFIHEKN